MPRPNCRRAFLLLAVSLFAGCAATRVPRSGMAVLAYDELGPQVAVHGLIGYEWYQWNAHGDSDPHKVDDVKVVVYRGIPLEKVKETYPVIKGRQDYRYLDYATAIDYLDEHENEPHLEHLRATRKKIVQQLGP
jgi:hypothetical protein